MKAASRRPPHWHSHLGEQRVVVPRDDVPRGEGPVQSDARPPGDSVVLETTGVGLRGREGEGCA